MIWEEMLTMNHVRSINGLRSQIDSGREDLALLQQHIDEFTRAKAEVLESILSARRELYKLGVEE